MLLGNRQVKYILLLILFQFSLSPDNILAQESLNLGQGVLSPSERDISLPPEARRLKLDLSDELLNAPNLRLEGLPNIIKIGQLKVVGNRVISTAELESLIEKESRQNLTKDNLRLIIYRINQAYRDRGYITSGIFTEPKLQRNNLIFLPITEGRIERIKITGLDRLKEKYILSRLIRDKQQVFNQEQFKQSLQQLQVNSLIKNISATVISGSSPHQSNLEVVVEEDDQFYVEVSLDNLGSPISGSFRRQLKVNHDNLLGFGDRIFADYTNTDGSNSLDALGYAFPLNSKDGTVSFSYGFGKAEAIESRLELLDIDFDYNRFNFSFSQPLYQTPAREFSLGLGLSRLATNSTLLDEPFPLARGASNDGELNITALSFFQDFTARGRRDRFDARSEIRVGVDLFDATINNGDIPDSNFLIWRGQTSYLRQLASDFKLSLKSYWQFSDRELVYLEQIPRKLFIIGREEEAFLLRGYRQGSLQADNGIFASGELQIDVVQIDSLNSVLQLAPFIDLGTAWNNDDVELDESTLVSVGLGIQLLVNNNFRARVDWGIPLIEQDLDRGSLQEDGVTFNIEYRPL